MAYEQKVNTGALFINDKKQKDTHPDLTGKLNVNGVEFWLSAWEKKTGAGAAFYSLSIKPKEDRSGNAVSTPRTGAATGVLLGSSGPRDDLDDSIPW